MKNLDHILLENQDGFLSLTLTSDDWDKWIAVQQQIWQKTILDMLVKEAQEMGLYH